jgi:hypothetical protein
LTFATKPGQVGAENLELAAAFIARLATRDEGRHLE